MKMTMRNLLIPMAIPMVLAMAVGAAVYGGGDADNDGKEAAKRWLKIRDAAWESFHETIDKNHDVKTENWMDAKSRRELLDKAVQAAIVTTYKECQKVEKEDKPKLPLPPIQLGSLAWMNYGSEPKQVRVDRGPSEDRKYLIRMTQTYKEWPNPGIRSVYDQQIEKTREVYMLVDEHSLYFPEKPAR